MGSNQPDVFTILIQTQQPTNGFGQDHLSKPLENTDFVNNRKKERKKNYEFKRKNVWLEKSFKR